MLVVVSNFFLYIDASNCLPSTLSSISLPYFITAVVCSSMLSTVVTLIISLLFCKIFYKPQKRRKKSVNIKDQSGRAVGALDSTLPMTTEHIYDDIEVTDKTVTLDLSKNIAYVCTKN